MDVLKNRQRELPYKLEDQEYRNRRKNFRIWGLPKSTQGEDLMGNIQTIFNPVLVREVAEPIKKWKDYTKSENQNAYPWRPQEM